MNQDLERLILSSPRKGREEQKVRLRPVLLKGRLKFQAEIFKGPQAFHENMSREEAVERVLGWMEEVFCQLQLSGAGRGCDRSCEQKRTCDGKGEKETRECCFWKCGARKRGFRCKESQPGA